MLAKRSRKWPLLLALGTLLLSVRLALPHLFAGSLARTDGVNGFCLGLGITLILGALFLARRGRC